MFIAQNCHFLLLYVWPVIKKTEYNKLKKTVKHETN